MKKWSKEEKSEYFKTIGLKLPLVLVFMIFVMSCIIAFTQHFDELFTGFITAFLALMGLVVFGFVFSILFMYLMIRTMEYLVTQVLSPKGTKNQLYNAQKPTAK